MFKDLVKKIFGSTRFFFSLLCFLLLVIILAVSFFGGFELTNQHVSLGLGVLGNAVAYICAETVRKSKDD